MGRPFQPRENYRKDAMSLNRLINVLERDEIRPREWVAEVKGLLEKAMVLLVSPPVNNNRPAPRPPTQLKKSA